VKCWNAKSIGTEFGIGTLEKSERWKKGSRGWWAGGAEIKSRRPGVDGVGKNEG
jgi:hypothetical protein